LRTQIAARWLAYEISLDGGAILLSAIPMERGKCGPARFVARDKDTGITTTRGINALEVSDQIAGALIEAAGDDRDDANGWGW
jgi:hypothetical protein